MILNGFWPLLYTSGYHHRFAAEPPSSCSSWFLHDMFTWWYLERYFHRAIFTSLYHLVVATLWITSANIIYVRSRNRWRKIHRSWQGSSTGPSGWDLLPQQHHPEMPRTRPKGLAVHLERFRRKIHHSFFKVYMVKFMGLMWAKKNPQLGGAELGLLIDISMLTP